MTWHFDPDNIGLSIRDGYGLLDDDGKPTGIHIETGGPFNDEEQRAKAHKIAATDDLQHALKAIIIDDNFPRLADETRCKALKAYNQSRGEINGEKILQAPTD